MAESCGFEAMAVWRIQRLDGILTLPPQIPTVRTLARWASSRKGVGRRLACCTNATKIGWAAQCATTASSLEEPPPIGRFAQCAPRRRPVTCRAVTPILFVLAAGACREVPPQSAPLMRRSTHPARQVLQSIAVGRRRWRMCIRVLAPDVDGNRR